MKKIIIVLLSLISICSLYSEFQINLGLDTGGEYKVKNPSHTDTYKIKNSFSPSIEIMDHNNFFYYGLGIEYQFPKSLDTDLDSFEEIPTFNFIPIYLTFKIPIVEDFKKINKNFCVEINGNFGHNSFWCNKAYNDNYNLHGGFYYGIGLDFVTQNAVIQLMYQVNTGSITYNGNSYYWDPVKVQNDQLSISLGVRFDNIREIQ